MTGPCRFVTGPAPKPLILCPFGMSPVPKPLSPCCFGTGPIPKCHGLRCFGTGPYRNVTNLAVLVGAHTVKARTYRFCAGPVPKRHGPVTCHLSPITCHLSPVKCHMSYVTCHRSLQESPQQQTFHFVSPPQYTVVGPRIQKKNY